MRNSRVVGFAIAAILSMGTVAQAQSTTTQPKQPRHARARAVGGGRVGGGLLRGITLSAEEQARVKAIHAKYAAEARSLRESLRPAMEELRTARQQRDSVAAKAAWERTAGDRQKLQAMMQHERTEIRAALTPENQKVFDANAKAMDQRRAEWNEKGKRARGGRAGLRGRRGAGQG